MNNIFSLCQKFTHLTVRSLQQTGCTGSLWRHCNGGVRASSRPLGPLLPAGVRGMASLMEMHLKGPPKRKRSKPKPTDGHPFKKAVVLKTMIKKPKKPNSANRKCVRVRMSNGKEATAYIPGEGHNLQEHHIVLVRCGRVQDLPGVKLKCIRGKYDLAHVKK